MLQAANDDRQARIAELDRRLADLNRRASATMTAAENATFTSDLAELLAVQEAMRDELAAENAAAEEELARATRRLQASGFPTVRRVVTDTKRKTVIF